MPEGSVPALQQEDKHAKRALARLAPENNSAQGAAATQPSAPEVLLFDLVGASNLATHHLSRHASKRRHDSHHTALLTSIPATQVASMITQVYDNGSKLDRATASKLPRDTLNCTALTKERNIGNVQTTMRRAHAHFGVVCKALHGHRPVIETTFYRKSNAFLLN